MDAIRVLALANEYKAQARAVCDNPILPAHTKDAALHTYRERIIFLGTAYPQWQYSQPAAGMDFLRLYAEATDLPVHDITQPCRAPFSRELVQITRSPWGFISIAYVVPTLGREPYAKTYLSCFMDGVANPSVQQVQDLWAWRVGVLKALEAFDKRLEPELPPDNATFQREYMLDPRECVRKGAEYAFEALGQDGLTIPEEEIDEYLKRLNYDKTLCVDEGCDHHGTPHVCNNLRAQPEPVSFAEWFAKEYPTYEGYSELGKACYERGLAAGGARIMELTQRLSEALGADEAYFREEPTNAKAS